MKYSKVINVWMLIWHISEPVSVPIIEDVMNDAADNVGHEFHYLFRGIHYSQSP
jgi:hypothetical protein